MLALYTIICEYDGGTFIAQVKANSPKSAILSWLGNRGSRTYISKRVGLQIEEGLNDDSPVAISGCRNVWCCSVSSDKGLLLINVVRTAENRASHHKG